MNWLPLFLNLFALGIAASVAVVPFREIGRYYFKFHATLALILVTVAVTLSRPWEALGSGPLLSRAAGGAALAFALAVLVENVLVRIAQKDLRIDAVLLPVPVGMTLVALAAGAEGLLTVHLLTAAAVLGTALVAMTTGHWYLSNAALSFGVLTRLCRLFVAAVAVKAGVAGIHVVLRWQDYQRLEAFFLMVMSVRVIAGIVLAGALAWMSLSCARQKSNQSATGILYVAVVFVLIGETISLYLTLGSGKPI